MVISTNSKEISMIKEYSKHVPIAVSPYFYSTEFKCRCDSKTCLTTKIDPALVTLLTQLRTNLSKPILIHSGYRCPAHNKAVSGAKHSMHLEGKAVDVSVKGMSMDDLYNEIKKLKFGGIGKASSFIHVDTGSPREWVY
jgi:zinc D-Ala-D-Ala carboxypeptidase